MNLIIGLICTNCGHIKAISEKYAFIKKHYCTVCKKVLKLTTRDKNK